MPVPSISDAEAQKLLDGVGDGLAKHLKELFKKIVQEETPEKAFHAIEILSRNLKHPRRNKQESCWDYTLTEEEIEGKLKYADSIKALGQDPADADGGLLQICALPNFLDECEMLKWAGVGFTESESLAIMNGLRHFAANAEGLKKVRLWGKILGTEKDYYIAEGQTDAGGEPDADDPDFEPLGSGANMFAYWVTTDINMPEWTRLPDVYPKNIVQSRALKKVFSGNLDAPVVTFPHFNGTEKDFLRAVIARITSNTVLNVKDYLSRNEEGAIQETEEFVFPSDTIMGTPAGWMHCVPHILNSGRCTYGEVDAEADPEGAAALEVQKVSDPEQDQLRDPVPKDWSFRRHDAGVISARSHVWPGAFTVYQNKQFTNLYVGYGLQRGVTFFFGAPPEILSEPADVPEQQEPWPPEGPPEAAAGGEEEGA